MPTFLCCCCFLSWLVLHMNLAAKAYLAGINHSACASTGFASGKRCAPVRRHDTCEAAKRNTGLSLSEASGAHSARPPGQGAQGLKAPQAQRILRRYYQSRVGKVHKVDPSRSSDTNVHSRYVFNSRCPPRAPRAPGLGRLTEPA